ncbi:malonate--CoA ligase [Aquabacterium sp. OR-4]|uniref:malonate--CoA ligase n=1 Tax=Aquabacterium sp. OR-4 TaxID=2978127 RepID=UPI0021B1FE83|nr:malonyl-CoA synthase [Aquabacterium sp. OR-4]MDT7834382.1 malonyl-CoA synthase [Aquabacterium sp. OR-4]
MSDNHNLFSALRAAFPADLDRPAIEVLDGPCAGSLYSWRDLDRATAMMANLIDSLGLPPASRIAVQTEKSVEALVLYLAVLRAGHVFLPLNTAYQEAEIGYFIGNAEPAVVVCAPKNFTWVSRIAFASGTAHVFTLGDDRSGSLLERAAHHGDQHTPAVKPADALAAILYTSGTTGRSKGAMLSHGNLLSNAQVLKSYWDWQPDDVLIHALPIFHVHGLFVASHGALLNGSTMLWLNRFEPKTVIAQFPRATVFMGVPTLYVRMLGEAALSTAQAAHMRLFISGSAPLLVETFDDWTTRTGHVILERYGMSETVMLTSNPGRASDGARQRGTVGPALPGVAVRVVRDDGSACNSGEIGHIQVRGPNVFAGYWRMPEKTAEEFASDAQGQRWFKTGDVGQRAADGFITIVGRSKDLIISGGYNVYPAEIEGFINEMPGVAESAVIGVPHPDFGEAVVAVVVARPGATLDAAAMVAGLKAQIANFKVPKQLFVVADLPRNAMGKVQKNLLREQHQGLFA